MIKPYYEDEDGVIWNCDCLENTNIYNVNAKLLEAAKIALEEIKLIQKEAEGEDCFTPYLTLSRHLEQVISEAEKQKSNEMEDVEDLKKEIRRLQRELLKANFSVKPL